MMEHQLAHLWRRWGLALVTLRCGDGVTCAKCSRAVLRQVMENETSFVLGLLRAGSRLWEKWLGQLLVIVPGPRLWEC